MPRVPRRSRWLIAAGPLALLLGLAPGTAPAQALTLPPPTGLLHTTYGPPSIEMLGPSEAVVAGDNHGNIDAWQTASVGGSWEFIRIATAGGGLLYSSPVLAWTGTGVVFAGLDSGGGLDFWSRAPDTGAWTRQQVAAGGYSSPALTVGNGSVMLTAIGPGGTLDFWSQPVDLSGWSAPQQVSVLGRAGNSPPAIAWASPYTVISVTRAGVPQTWLRQDGSTSWVPDTPLVRDAVAEFGTPALAVTGSAITLVSANQYDSDSQVWILPGGHTTWILGAAPSGSEPSIAWSGSDLVLVNEADSDLWSMTSSTNYLPAVEIASGTADGRSYAGPQVAADGSGTFVAATAGGGLYSWAQPAGASTWTPVLIAAATG
jgi:hypothetical protein